MAEGLSITEDGLKQKIIDVLQASYVDIEDMSGKPTLFAYFCSYPSTAIGRLLTNHSTQVVAARPFLQ